MTEQRSMVTAGPSGIGEKNVAAGGVPAAPPQAAPARFGVSLAKQKWLLLAAAVVIGGLAYLGWMFFQPKKLPDGFAKSNGRIEATEVDIATKLAGRILDELVDEGDYVTAGQVLAHMDIEVLKAERHEAEAMSNAAKSLLESARSTLAQRKSEKAANEAVVEQRKSELHLANLKVARARKLTPTGAMPQEEADTIEAAFLSARASLESANANVAAAQAAISTAEAMVFTAEATVVAAQAKIDRVQADINDSTLKAPREGRVQYRVTQPGEVLSAGGKVLNMVDLGDVYMTFFLPTDWAGRVQLGAEARIVLDAAPQFVIPAKVTFVADVAQFTPKTVETAEERQKLTFRIKAHIPKELLKKYVRDVKTGLPGMAYVRLDPKAEWPANLQVKFPE